MTVIFKSHKQNDKAIAWAHSEGLVCITVFPAHVVVYLERSAGLRLTDAGFHAIHQALLNEGKRRGTRKWRVFGNNTVFIEGKLPPQWVAEQLEGILSRDENVEKYETFFRRTWKWRQPVTECSDTEIKPRTVAAEHGYLVEDTQAA
jgi:hypothetical protein